VNQHSDTDRLLRHWMSDGPSTMPDRVVDVVADRISRQPQRRTWRLRGRPFVNTYAKLAAAAAAVLIVGFVGWQLLPGPNASGGPSPTPFISPAPTASPTPLPTPRTFEMQVQGEPLTWTATASARWTRGVSWALTSSQGFGGPTGIGIGASGAVNVPSDPCDGVGKVSDATSPADVVAELEARDDLVVSNVTPTTMGGYSGTRVDVELPADLSACGADYYIIFAEPDGSGLYAQGPAMLMRTWILDVEGRPIVFWITSFAGTPAGDLADAQGIVDSLVITP
jgi:hypothetical protein